MLNNYYYDKYIKYKNKYRNKKHYLIGGKEKREIVFDGIRYKMWSFEYFLLPDNVFGLTFYGWADSEETATIQKAKLKRLMENLPDRLLISINRFCEREDWIEVTDPRIITLKRIFNNYNVFLPDSINTYLNFDEAIILQSRDSSNISKVFYINNHNRFVFDLSRNLNNSIFDMVDNLDELRERIGDTNTRNS